MTIDIRHETFDIQHFMAAIDEDARRRFESAWIAHQPMAIQECLPAADSPAWLATLEELVLIELEFAWKLNRATAPIVEDYLSRFPQLRDPDVLLRLIEQEYSVRQAHGDRPAREQYRKRFPEVIVTGRELPDGKAPPLTSLNAAAETYVEPPSQPPASPAEPQPRAAPDANLLFAVIAFQMEYLYLGQFAAACRAWADDKSRSLAELLVERGWITPQAREELAQVVERKLKHCGGDPQATLNIAADDVVRNAIRSIDDPRIRDLLSSLPAPAGRVLLETIDHRPEGRARYTLTRLHAEGGLGRVWVARDGDLNRDVALKELKPAPAKHPEAARRFLKEAQVTGQLEHPNIVPVYELGRRPEDNQPYYTMRFVRGQTLREAVAAYHRKRREGTADPIEWLRLLQAFVSVCNAVSYAHSRGVIHRDLKPENIILGDFGEVLVLDWGLAKTNDSIDERITPVDMSNSVADIQTTLSGRILGTPAYMAPEQADGRVELIDERTDVYGLGSILFEILTGRPPHLRGDTADIIGQIVRDPTPLPRQVNPAAPRALDAICAHAMAKGRGDRYPAAEELARDMQRYLADEPVGVYREPLTMRVGRFVRRHRTMVASAAAAVLVTLVSSGIGLSLWIQSQNRARQETDARMARLKTSVQADQELVKRELDRENYTSVDEILDRDAIKLLSDRNKADVDARPDMVDLRTTIINDHELLHRVAQFYKLVDEAERLAFFEYDDRAEDTATAAVNLFGALDDPQWWEHLPAKPLSALQHDNLQEEVFRQLLFLAAMRAKHGLMNLLAPDNAPNYRAALAALAAANRWKPSESARMLAVFCHFGLGEAISKQVPLEPKSFADFYFLGIMNFWVALMPNDPTSQFFLKGITAADFSNALEKSEQFLRRAASAEPRHYWTYFWLGWNRLAVQDYSAAELAFDSCIALKPDYSLGYAYRGYSLLMESRTTEDPGIRSELQKRGFDDLARARSIEPSNPEFAWRAGEALDYIGDTRAALQADLRAVALEEPLETWAGRRVYGDKQAYLTHMFDVAKEKTGSDPRNADAWTALAAAAWQLNKLDDADQAAEEALKYSAGQPVALAVRGNVALLRQKFDAALADFHAALVKEPRLWWAAYGEAKATETQGTPDQALEKFKALDEIAETDWQRVAALVGRARILTRLNRADEADEALKAAQAIDPRAGKSK